MMPKNKGSLEREYQRCIRKRAFVEIPKEKYVDYVKEAYSDIDSAEEDIERSPKWALVKAYQALLIMSNALLIKKMGLYSKDHGCILIAFMHENIIPPEIMDNISVFLRSIDKNGTFFDEVSNIRIARNKYMYLPEEGRNFNVSVKEIVDEIRNLIRIMGDVE